ncbi:urease accessory protein UreE [Anabaena sp. FACHB-1237]|uniref:urease accessory protein UreE n=1 Tax=Anabaena sp. FACHB-1237 TaxID=2692769 RepID=UPI001681B9BB|nr:urease accessory protein UreE [Anabaena sp. FACHB-1237]MBD2139147.1 urease accessory protein UreE [Anabaena sp. FACHB-1237]
MLIFTKTQVINSAIPVNLKLYLTAEERSRSRYRFITQDNQEIFLRLPRGTILQDGDILTDENEENFIQIIAKPEPVFTVIADEILLLRAAYHLGNRHIPVEINTGYLRLSPDAVLREMILHLGLTIKEEIVTFYPELGAYGNHSHT